MKNISWLEHTAIPKVLANGKWCDSIICNIKKVADLHHGKPHSSFVGGRIEVQQQPETRGLEKVREWDFLTSCRHLESVFHFLPLGLFDATVEFISFLTLSTFITRSC